MSASSAADGAPATTTAPDEVLIRLWEAAPDAVLAVDRAGLIVAANAATERIFGYPRTELVGKPVDLLVPHRFRAAHPRRRDSYDSRPVPRPMGAAGTTLAALRNDGSEFPAEISLSALPESGLVVAAVRDVTERVSIEHKYRGLLDAAPDAIVAVDESGRILLVNSQAERLFGYDRAELVGQAIETLVPEASRSRHPQLRRRYTDLPVTRPMGAGLALVARRKDGTEFPAEISLSALSCGGDMIVSAAVRDVSDRIAEQDAQRQLAVHREQVTAAEQRRRLEEQLHQAQRLESLGQLAGGVAHDFNNLLAVMLNYTRMVLDLLEDPAAPSAPDRGQACRDLHQVLRAGGRATELTHQLLAFGRREVVRPRPLDLNQVIDDVQQLLRRSIGEHIDLHVELDPHLWPIMADPGQIEQILVNLAVNARDAMPGGGTLSVHTRNMDLPHDGADRTLPALPAGRYARVRIADTGHGIPADVLDRVFEPFFTTKPAGQGTGLGLATVYGIISQAGGYATIQSTPGAGTAFIIALPATDEAMPATGDPAHHTPATEPTTRQPPRAGETILVVEDEEALREVTARILSRNGYQVIAAADGPQAIKICQDVAQPVSLVLSDVVMPRMNGAELAEQIHQIRPDVKVLFMSGYAQPFATGKGVLDADTVLITKPFSQAELIDRIRETLDADYG
ncbi:PAS domain S-box protein [Paractinoplanes ferrugineus]|uniref:histidine kinase n=1 Tax=Paractinoplanes ferrugineus TaxID=113564 RepID=A0A919J635_9ACTN|nr:PAS domain S-box protein [Actinoplanes ferrugineus]GIE13284.1 histidine kinase [Actinoplanes ferrugineus]